MEYKVLLYDIEKHEDAARWAYECCISFIQADEVDVSDFSFKYDTISEFVFAKEADALIFRLRWA